MNGFILKEDIERTLTKTVFEITLWLFDESIIPRALTPIRLFDI